MDLVIEFFSYLIQVGFWYVIMSFVINLLFKDKHEELMRQKEELINRVNQLVHRIQQEKHGDMYYWFDQDSNEFLAQGKNDEEIRKQLLQRFQGHIFLLDEHRAMAGPELKVLPIKDLTLKS
jgi:hypothetical protein